MSEIMKRLSSSFKFEFEGGFGMKYKNWSFKFAADARITAKDVK